MSRRKQTDNRLALTADVEIIAAIGDDDAGKPATFEIVAYNGGELRTPEYMRRFGKPVVIDLAGLSYSPSITANMDHDTTKRVGHVTEKRNDGRQLILAGVVSGTGDAATEVVENSKLGYPWQASVEALPTSALEEVRAGRSVVVNGRTIQGPAVIARKSRLFGVAFLARGADDGTAVSIAASAANSTKELDMQFQEWIKAMGFEPEDLTDVQTKALQSRYDAEIKATADDSSAATVVKAALAFDLDELKVAYAKHEATIEATAFEFAGKVETADLTKIKAGAIEKALGLKKTALEQEWAATRFEVESIKAAADFKVTLMENARPTGPAIHSSSKDVTSDVIEAAMCMSLGMNVDDDYKEQTLETANRNFRRIGLQEVLVMAAMANGYQGRHRVSQDNLRDVLSYALPQSPIQASAFSTTSLSGILSNVANKQLLAGFMEEDQTWREFAEVKPVSDFKTVTSYRMLDDMEYEELGPNGEIRHGKLGQETFTRSADTYAKMFALTRTQIINDDLGAFDDVRTRLGRGAARKFRRLFWETFINNSSFFTSARGNYITGGTTNLALDSVGLELGVKAYRKLKSGDKKQVGVGSLGAPSKLLVPPELEFIALRLFQSTLTNTDGPDSNIHAGKYRPHVVNELSDTAYTGYSATAWYLFGSILMPIVVSFLNGVETPTVESADADFHQLGVQFRGYHDFGVDTAEWLAGVKSKGAA